MKQLLTIFLLLMGLSAVGQTVDDYYPVAFDKDMERPRNDRHLDCIGLDGMTLSVDNAKKMYNDMTRRAFIAKAGQTVMPSFNYTGRWMHGFVYVDKDRNGQFDVTAPGEHGLLTEDNDLVSFSGMTLSDGEYNSAGEVADMSTMVPVPFQIPTVLQPGFYMMRYKVDWDSADPAGNMDEKNSIITNGGGIVDVRLRIYDDEQISLHGKAFGGRICLNDGTALDDGATWHIGQSLPLLIIPDEGMQIRQLTVRHGVLDGDSLVQGVAQYGTEVFTAEDVDHGLITLDGTMIDGDVVLTAEFEEASAGMDDERYTLVFSDEFNQPDGSLPNPDKWQSSVRRRSTWNRFVSSSPDVAFIRNGSLVCRAIPNPDPDTDDVPMLSGSMESRGLFSFTYGKVEIRLRTIPHTGSFPAAWMMPQPPCDTWPNAGEIDIFESVDSQNKVYHTVHSHWTYDLGNKNNPQSSFTSTVDIASWHVYGIDWDDSSIVWTIDGQKVATYGKSDDHSVLSQGQWPFNHDFYLILNQSVGDGSWASKPDLTFTYETEFDYVRVYQKVTSGIVEVGRTQTSEQTPAIYDISGRRIPSNRTLKPGIYLVGGRKILMR